MRTFRRLAALCLLCAALWAASARAEVSQPRPELLYFYENYCDSCHPEEDFIETFHDLTGRRAEEYAYTAYNVRYEKNRALYEEIAEACGVAPEDRRLPMAVVDGAVYSGQAKLLNALPRDFLENTSTDSVIYYLYSPACGSCAAAEKAVDALPESVSITRGQVVFESRVVVNRINIYDDPSIARALFERYRVPEDSRATPIAFLGEDYLAGAEAIEKRLANKLKSGGALGTPLAVAGAEPFPITAAGTALAGLVAGFNPCALSMLLLFLSILLSGGERAAGCAAAYLAAKLAAYIAIGAAFLSALSAWNSTWLPLAAKWLLTAVGGVLIALNLMDAVAARRERYGEIRNQLPRGLRRFLNAHIRSVLQGKGAALLTGAALPLSAAGLGVVVAAGEFLCAGQLYLAALTAGLSAGSDHARQFALLVLFCLAFLLPSVIVTVAVLRSRDMFSASNALLRHMPLIKLATAAAMLCIILAAWFLV